MTRNENCSSVMEIMAENLLVSKCSKCTKSFERDKSNIEHLGPLLVCQIKNPIPKPLLLDEDLDMDKFVILSGSYTLFSVLVVAHDSGSIFQKQGSKWIKYGSEVEVNLEEIPLGETLMLLYRAKKLGKSKHELKKLDEVTRNAFFFAALYSGKLINTNKLSHIGHRLHTLYVEYMQMKPFLKELITNLELDIGLTDTENIVEQILQGATNSSQLSIEVHYTCVAHSHTQYFEKSKQVLILKPPIARNEVSETHEYSPHSTDEPQYCKCHIGEKITGFAEDNHVTLHACYAHTSRKHQRKKKTRLCSVCKSQQPYIKQKRILTVGSVLVINVKKSNHTANGIAFPKRFTLSEFGLNLREFELAAVILDGDGSDGYLQCMFTFDGHWVKFAGTVQQHHVKIDPFVLLKAHYAVYKEIKEEINTEIADVTTSSWEKLKHIELKSPARGIVNDGNKCVFIALLSILYYSQPMWDYLKKNYISLPEEFVNFLLRFQDIHVLANHLKTEMNQIITKYSQVDIDKLVIPEVVFLKFVKVFFGEHSSNLFAAHRNVICSCGHVIASEEDSQPMLTVCRTTETNLNHLLEKLFSSTQNIECSCGRQVSFNATFSTSPILVIDIKNETVDFPSLELTEIVHINSHPLFPQNYRLYGELSNSGQYHVVADVRFKNHWFEIDDDRVREKSGIRNVSDHPKMLFFERIETSLVSTELRSIKNSRKTRCSCLSSPPPRYTHQNKR